MGALSPAVLGAPPALRPGPAPRGPAARRAALVTARRAGPRWADRARRELRAAGEASVVRAPLGADVLTAQELEIARLAARGLTNREIGQQLHLSHRTVGSHLYHLFPKLGVTSRAQLAEVLREAG